MANTIKKTKYFYPPRPGSGEATFSDKLVGIQLVDGGGLTQANFEFTTNVVEKVNRTFNTGEYESPVNLEDLGISGIFKSENISKQFNVFPNFDISNVTNFTLYGSLSKRFGVSVTKIINFFPASLDVLFNNNNFITGNTAINISYDLTEDETYLEINVDRLHNPFGIDYSISASTNLSIINNDVSPYRNLYNSFLDYAIVIDGIDYKVNSFLPSQTLTSGYIAFYVSGSPFGLSATTYDSNFIIRPNYYQVDRIFAEEFDEVEKFLLNRLVDPIYTATFQVPAQDNAGQYYLKQQQLTWPLDGLWNLDIRSQFFETYLNGLQFIAESFDEIKTNLISRFLTSGSLKEFDTIGRKVEKVFQIYGRSFDQLKQYIDGLSFANSIHYVPSNDIPSELLTNLAETLGWSTNFSPITDEDYLTSIFGNQSSPIYPGFARAQTPTEVNYAFYRNLILNSAYIYKSKGTRRSVEFLMNLIGVPEALLEFNEHVEVVDKKVDVELFDDNLSKISGGTAVDDVPVLDPNDTFNFQGITFTAFTTNPVYTNVTTSRKDYPVDNDGYPSSPVSNDSMFFQKGAGWYEQTPEHTSPEEIFITQQVFTGQNTNIQTQLRPFNYGEDYLQIFRKFPHIRQGYDLTRTVDNNKSWVLSNNDLRIARDAGYNSYYLTDDERLTLNIKNIDLFLNPSQGIIYDIWYQSRINDYPFPKSGLTEYYPVPGGLDSTYINPSPQTKTFFEFYNTFWLNMINTRNRLYITDGKTGGYPTLQSIWWKYLDQFKNIGKQNNQYTYQKLIDFSLALGPYWMKLVEQMIPATTIWQAGIKYENSVLQRQKFVYRRPRGCVEESLTLPQNFFDEDPKENANPETMTPVIMMDTISYDALNEFVEVSIYAWTKNNGTLSSFSDILYRKLNQDLSNNGILLSECAGANSLTSEWYVDLRLGDRILIQRSFYTGVGINDTPNNTQWENALNNFLPSLINYNLGYSLERGVLRVINLTNQPLYSNQTLTLNVGINIEIFC